MKHRKILSAGIALICMIAVCVAAFAEGPINRKVLPNTAQSLNGMPDAARQRTDTIAIGVPDLFGETNPFWARTTGDGYLSSILYDELLFSSSNGEMGAGVATYEWAHVLASDRFSRETNAVVTFTIRNEVCYADGSPVTSDDFINAIYLLAMPGFDGVYDISRADILGFEAYQNGAAEISGVGRINDRSFSVTLLGENKRHLDFFAFPALRVSLFGDMRRPAECYDEEGHPNERLVAAFDQETLKRVRSTDAAEMAYGQYFLTDLKAGEKADLLANQAYWRGAPMIENAQLLVVPIGREFDAITSGKVDIISLPGSVEIVDANLAAGFINLYTWEGDVVGLLGMDLTNPLFSDVLIRHALTMGFDRESARRASIDRYGKVPNIMLFDAFSEKPEMYEEKYAYDEEAASKMLTDVGWILAEDGYRYQDGKKFSFTLTYNSPNPIFDRMLPILTENYKSLGLDVKLNAVSFEALIEAVDQQDVDMYFEAMRMPQSLSLATDLFAGDSVLNQFGFSDAWIEQALALSMLEDQPDRQAVYLEMVFRELYEQLPFIPVYRRMEMLLANARVMNVTITTAHDITSDMYRFFLVDTLEGQW